MNYGNVLVNILYRQLGYMHTVVGSYVNDSVLLVGAIYRYIADIYVTANIMPDMPEFNFACPSYSKGFSKILLPILSISFITIGHWLTEKTHFKYVDIKYKYSFLKSLKPKPKKKTFIFLPKFFILCTILLYYDTPTKMSAFSELETYHNNTFFTIESISLSQKLSTQITNNHMNIKIMVLSLNTYFYCLVM